MPIAVEQQIYHPKYQNMKKDYAKASNRNYKPDNSRQAMTQQV